MTFLLDPERARAYQFLCDHPTGSTRSWAAQLGWKPAKLTRFLAKLEEKGLAEIDRHGNYGSAFRPVSRTPRAVSVPSRGVSPVSSVVVVKEQLDKVPSYGATPEEEERLRDGMRLIDEFNRALKAKFKDTFTPILRDNLGSLAAAKRILKVVPVDRAAALVFEAGMVYTPEVCPSGELPHSLGHPFIKKYVINEYRRIERELVRGQLPLLFVDRVEQRPVYGARKIEPDVRPTAQGETIDAGLEEFHRGAASKTKPQRMA